MLVHYLNVPAVDDSGKPCGPVLCSINTDRKEWAKWSKEELIGQLKPMCELSFPPLTALLLSLASVSATHTCPKPENGSQTGSATKVVVVIIIKKTRKKKTIMSKLQI